MVPFLPMILGGAALGALTNKKPLKGALMGGALGAGGGLLAGAAGGAGGAAGLMNGGAQAAGMGGAAGETAGLLGLPQAAAWGPQSQSAMLAAQNEGFGATGQKLLTEAAGTKTPFGVNAMAGFENGMGKLKQFNTAVKPFQDAAGTAMTVNSMFSDNSAPTQAPQLPQQMGAQTLQALAQGTPQYDAGQDAEMRRKRRMGLLGGVA